MAPSDQAGLLPAGRPRDIGPSMQAVFELLANDGYGHGGAQAEVGEPGGVQPEVAKRACGLEKMQWNVGEKVAVMLHEDARLCLATPLRVSGAPPARMLSSVRVTEGEFCDTGERFKRVDSWRARSVAHLSLGRPWRG